MFASGKAAAVSSEANYIEDVFSTWLYTGNGSTQTITNGIDLSGKGGLVWTKGRGNFYANTNHGLFDTARGTNKFIASNLNAAQGNESTLTAFNSNGFSLGADVNYAMCNGNTENYASWTFRKQPKFFDVVTYTGTGVARTIAHSLGSVPACIIVKCTNAVGKDWQVYHTSLGNTKYINLNLTSASTSSSTIWNSTTPTSTVFSLGADGLVNDSGDQYVAYLFAHDAGGFGLTGTDNVISCGSFTTDGSGNATVDLGYEPQWVLYKRTSSTGSWLIIDNMRGDSANATNNANYLLANTSDAEGTATWFYPTATGFTGNANSIASTDFIYIAIRRGPMKVPTSGTSVFLPSTVGASNNITVGFPADTAWFRYTGSDNWRCFDRLRSGYELATNLTDAEGTYNYYPTYIDWDSNSVWYQNLQNGPVVDYFFRRAPSFFDEVCYTGTGTPTNFTHNLGVVPELMIVKRRNASSIWAVYAAPLANASTSYLELSEINAVATGNTVLWNSTSPTSTVFTIGSSSNINTNGSTNVAYLFATCAGVSKVGSYTGTGTTLQVNCGFTGGARFVLIKRTDSTGDWYVWDSARGIVSGNDPYLLLNSTAAEVTNTDYIDTYSAGFEISSTAPAAINASGGSFIFLAIA